MTREWVEIRTEEGAQWWIGGGCRHDNAVPVEALTGEVVAGLCLDCGVQLPPPPATE